MSGNGNLETLTKEITAFKIREMTELSNYVVHLRKHPRLTYLFFELTDACNLSCLHCGSSCNSENNIYLPFEAIKKVIDEVSSKYFPENIMVCLTGGEPLLHPDFFEIASYITSRGFSCGITTNGTMVNEDYAYRIVDAHINSVMFSLDGLEENHNWLRNNRNSFLKTINGIKNLRRISNGNCIVAATTVVHKKNIGELHELYDYVKTLDLDLWRLVNVEPIGRAEEHSDLLLNKNDFIKLFEFIKEKRFNDGKMDVSFGCSHYLTPEYERMIRDTYFICGAGIYVASVLCNGDIYACLDIERNEKLVQGNIYSDSFTDIWENRFEFFRKDRTNLSSKCKNCPEKIFCKGDSAHTWDFGKSQPKLCINDIINKAR